MTQNESGAPSSGAQSKVQATREQTSQVGHSAVQAGAGVAKTAGEQGRNVAAETGRQARHLLDETTTQLRERADAQQKRTAAGLRTLADELQSMASQNQQQGPATDMVRRASGTAHQAADWLEHRQPGDVVNELRDYARRHPGMFLAGALAAGVLAGRMARDLAAGGRQDGNPQTPAPTNATASPPTPIPDGATGGGDGVAGDGRPRMAGQEPAAMPEATRAEAGR
jgi:gas vesicle protein